MKRTDEENEAFRQYREKVHGTDDERRPAIGSSNKTMRAIFAIIMIIVYIGVGVLMLINFFQWDASIDWMRWIIGIVLIVYGVFRAYRYLAGIDR